MMVDVTRLTLETFLLPSNKNFLTLLRANLGQSMSNGVKWLLLYPLIYQSTLRILYIGRGNGQQP